MLFNSLDFVFFLALAACGFRLCPTRWRTWYILATSYVYYCSWSPLFGLLLLGVSVFAFYVGKEAANGATEESRWRWLAAGVVVLLLPLATIKYAAVIAASLSGASIGQKSGWLAAPDALAAVGISYYTFKLVSYVVDVYWQRVQPAPGLVHLASYAAFFPQVLSGPIQRSGSFLDELAASGRADAAMLGSGTRRMLFGFFKKLVVADRLGLLVDQIFAQPEAHSGAVLALGAYLFALQLYADFSGITDIAIGAGRLFGIAGAENFDSPFYAENIQEFWRRWHMTLTSWLRDYVFTPLQITLRTWGQIGLAVSLSVNMVAIGVWHGAQWTYLVFGVVHAVLLIVSSLTLRRRKKAMQRCPGLARLHALTGPLVTFHMVVASFVIFRAETVSDAWYILRHGTAGLWAAFATAGQSMAAGLAESHLDWSLGDTVIAVWGLVLMEIVHILKRRGALAGLLVKVPGWVRWCAYCALGFAMLVWGETASKQFIYVRF